MNFPFGRSVEVTYGLIYTYGTHVYGARWGPWRRLCDMAAVRAETSAGQPRGGRHHVDRYRGPTEQRSGPNVLGDVMVIVGRNNTVITM